MAVDPRDHWEQVYRTRQPDEVSWYRPHLDVSLGLIAQAVPDRDARIIDVGAGESTLTADLLQRGYRNLVALDISPTALGVARARLGADAVKITWLCGDVREFPLERHGYDLWHDRAVFHFLTAEEDRGAYVRQVLHAVRPGGHVIIATFGPQGPTRCSGLEIVRYAPAALHREFGDAFQLLAHRTELHETPTGATQQFTYCLCKVVETTPSMRRSG